MSIRSTLLVALAVLVLAALPAAAAEPIQRGIDEGHAMSLAVNGFINDLVREFPMEYSVELKRLIDLEMEGSVG